MTINPKLYIGITLIGLALVSILVLFRECTPLPKDDSQAKIDSILIQRDRREDSLKTIIDSTRIEAEAAAIEASRSNDQAELEHKEAHQSEAKYNSLKGEYERLKQSSNCAEITQACDATIEEAGKTIAHLDSAIKLKDKSIEQYRNSLHNQEIRAKSLEYSRDAFKSDFMKLQTQVVGPLQIQLKEERHQHAANRTGKKIFATTTAILAGIVGVIILSK